MTKTNGAQQQVPRVRPTGSCASRGGADAVSTGATHGFFAMGAFCAWVYAWREGYGRALLQAAEREVKMRGVARHLYDSSGYEITSLHMRKELAPAAAIPKRYRRRGARR